MQNVTSIYKYGDARKYAEQLAEEIGGWVSDREIEVDERNAQFDEIDQWSGVTSAIQVCNAEGEVVEYVAYWNGDED